MNPDAPLTQYFRLLPAQQKALAKLKITTVHDVLYHFPARYGDTSEIRNIGSLVAGDTAVVFGKISGLKTSKAFVKKIPMAEGWVEDDTGRIKIVWFHQAYLAKMIKDGSLVRVEGKVSERKSELYFSNPKIEIATKIPIGVGHNLFGSEGEEHSLYPVYPESKGITSNWFFHAIEKIFKSGTLEKIVDPIPLDILEKYSLPTLADAFIYIHAPKKQNDSLASRKRFAFEEIFFIQLQKQIERATWSKEKAFDIETTKASLDNFVKHFPFAPTEAQQKAIAVILSDFHSGHAMARLLEGDVGSGKTAVAAAATYAVVTSRPQGKDFGNLQVAYMAPTEILAKQQFENFITMFEGTGIAVGLITGSGCRKFPSKVSAGWRTKSWTNISKSQLTKWVANGEIPIVVGTHALIYKSVKFKHLALTIIDEQHRFGTGQRQRLVEKDASRTPHLLSMTATPIPRTLSLTLYGDLDLTLLDELPKGRKPVITKLVLPKDREKIYEEIKKELRDGRQLYVITPRVHEPDPDKELSVIAKSATEEAKYLQEHIFKEFKVGLVHGQMTPTEKDKAMKAFLDHETDILVATSVIEVGVNVPNATVMLIEGAERFGLSQLHQLRGRVVRSSHQAYCYVFSESSSTKTIARLKALSTAKNGFELAEFDLSQRGAGELYGARQWGMSDIAMEGLQNLKLVEAARTEARAIAETDLTLSHYPLLKQQLASTDKIHFE